MEKAIEILVWSLLALPVTGTVVLVGCGILDMAESGWKRWRAWRRRAVRQSGRDVRAAEARGR